MTGAMAAGIREIAGLKALSGGASRETWSADVITDDGQLVPVIVRRHPPSAMSVSIMYEARALRAAAARGVPVPAVYVATDDPAVLGAPALIMQRIAGETLPRRILRDGEFAAARSVLTSQCGSALAAIHRIPAASVPGVAGRPAPLDRVAATLAGTGGAYPALDAALGWLRSHEPPGPPQPIVLHGDFRLGNLLVDAAGLCGVLDWELLHLGDPHEDLAWLCAKTWRFGGPGVVGGFGHRDDLLAAYAGAGGMPIDEDTLRWWDVLSTLKWAVMCIEQSQLYLTGKEESLELLALGRRVSVCEWDLLDDLDELDPLSKDSRPPTVAAERPGYSSPSVAEILDGVRRFLMADISDVTTGRPRYLARVAANLLAIAAREVGAGDSGPQPGRGPLSRDQIRREVATKLSFDNPGYGG